MAEDGVFINGLFIEGASWNWDQVHLQEQKPKILIDPMPAIHFKVGFYDSGFV